MGELDAMVADVVAMRHEVRGNVRLGMIGTTGRWLVPRLFEELRAQHPQIELTVADGTNTTLEPQLVTGQLDVAAISMPTLSDELSSSPLFEEDLVLVIPVTHPIARSSGPLPLRALADLRLLLPAPGTALRQELDAAARRAGVELHAAMQLDGIRLIASLTFDGHGPAILPATAIPAHMRRQFCLLRVDGLPRRQVGVTLRTRGLPSAPTRVLIDILRRTVEEAGSELEGVHPALGTAGR